MRLFITFFIVLSISLFQLGAQEPVFRLDSCIQLVGSSPNLGRGGSLKFYNACPEKMFITVCVTMANGKVKLFKSGRRVPIAGWYQINIWPGDSPVAFDVNASPYEQPLSCD